MKILLKTQKNNLNAGFTLVELMVSLMIFTIVVLAAIGSLYNVNNASRKIQAMRAVLDNVSFATESISRTIRTSNGVFCNGFSNEPTRNCTISDGGSGADMLWVDSTLGVDDTSGVDNSVTYQLADVSGRGVIQKKVGPTGSWIDLTAPEVNVKRLTFYVDGADPKTSVVGNTDQKQPSVAIFIQGEASNGQDVTPFAIQTYVSVRATE